MKAVLARLARSEAVHYAAVLLVVFGFIYLRNGAEYFSGNSGGAYWDNMNYCGNHQDGQMNIYGQLVSCREILEDRRYCEGHIDQRINIVGTSFACDAFLGVEDDPPENPDS